MIQREDIFSMLISWLLGGIFFAVGSSWSCALLGNPFHGTGKSIDEKRSKSELIGDRWVSASGVIFLLRRLPNVDGIARSVESEIPGWAEVDAVQDYQRQAFAAFGW